MNQLCGSGLRAVALGAQQIKDGSATIVVAGGPLSGDAKSTLKDVSDAIAAGAQGVVVGRKVWQRPAEETSWLIAEMAKASRAKFKRLW
jgi:class I fructose-bisphosphate aldolase